MFIDEDSRRRYSIQDLTAEELQALSRAIRNAGQPDSRTLERLGRNLEITLKGMS